MSAPQSAAVLTMDHVLRGPGLLSKLFVPACIAFVAAFLVWAAYAPLDEVARGGGRVIPSTQLQLVQNLEGGILSEILAREGDKVTKGQVLIRIDTTTAGSQYREQKVRVLAHQAAIARLEAEINGTPLAFPPEVLQERSVVEQETQLYNSRRELYQSSVGALRQLADQRQREIGELESRASHLQQSHALASEELRVTEPLFQQGAVSKVEVLRMQREVNELAGNLQSTRLLAGKARAGLAEAQSRVNERIGQLRSEALGQLTENRTKLQSLVETQVAAEDRVARAEVRAPVDGIIKRIHMTTIGGVIKPGGDILEIVPIDDRLLVEAKVSPNDIAFIRPGQEVLVKLTAYDFALYGGIQGEVEQVAADSIVDEKGNVNYQVLVRTHEGKLERNGRSLEIIPGMVAEIDIITGKKTILQYLLKPVLRMRDYGLQER